MLGLLQEDSLVLDDLYRHHFVSPLVSCPHDLAELPAANSLYYLINTIVAEIFPRSDDILPLFIVEAIVALSCSCCCCAFRILFFL